MKENVYTKETLLDAFKKHEIPRHQYYRAIQKIESYGLSEISIKDNSFTCYAIQNDKNKKIFIGTCNEYGGFEKIVIDHLRRLKANIHYNEQLQNDFNELKMNEESLSFYILKTGISCTDVDTTKVEFIQYYKTYDSRFGYNTNDSRVFKELDKALKCIKTGVPKKKTKV